MDLSEDFVAAELKSRNTVWRPVQVGPGALVITDEQLWGRAEVLAPLGVKPLSAPSTSRLLV